MIVYQVLHNSATVQFSSLEQAEQYAQTYGCAAPEQIEVNTSIDYISLISEHIKSRQAVASQLLQELYAKNTLAGITIEQSDKMFDDYADVILRIREGAFPTALYRLSQKVPDEFVTAELIAEWQQTIQSFI